jgi:hypothetical protein
MGDDNEQSVNRHTAWWALTIFGAITTAAHFTAISDQKDSVEGYATTRDDKWTGSVMIISMCLSFFGCLASTYLAEHFVDQWAEGVTSVIVLALWAAAMPTIMDPDSDQAVTTGGDILNANLYFFSWASLVTAVWMFGSYKTFTKYLKRGDDSVAPPNMSKSDRV